MRRGHPRLPSGWMIVDRRSGPNPLGEAARLPKGSGILLIAHDLPASERRRIKRGLARVARRRGLRLIDEADGRAVRVHGQREMTRALAQGATLLLLSPVYGTRSHPDWAPLPRMRVATLARLSPVPVLALGGMSRERFQRVRRLGLHGWAGIDGWADLSEKPGQSRE